MESITHVKAHPLTMEPDSRGTSLMAMDRQLVSCLLWSSNA